MNNDLISRSALIAEIQRIGGHWHSGWETAGVLSLAERIPAVDAVEVVHGYHEGDVCIYGFAHENKSRAIVEIVRILSDERGVAEIKFHKVFVDDTGNGLFDYLLKSGKTMNASFKYLKNITPRTDGERREDG